MRCKQVPDKFVLYVIHRIFKICICFCICICQKLKYQVLTKEEQKKLLGHFLMHRQVSFLRKSSTMLWKICVLNKLPKQFQASNVLHYSIIDYIYFI